MRLNLFCRLIAICCAVFLTACVGHTDDTSPEAFADPPLEARPGA